MRGVLKRRDSESGASAVEFALVLLPFLLLLFGVIQYGLYFFSMQTGTYAVQQGVRRVSVGDCTDNTLLKSYLKNRLGAATTASAPSLTPSVVYTDSSGTVIAKSAATVGDNVALTLSFPSIDFHFPFIPVPNGGTVTRTSNAALENISDSGVCS